MSSRQTGMTLIELMVVIMILGIIITVGIPSYRSYIIRANRVDATSALLRLAANQERFYMQNNTYASGAQLAAALPAGLGIPGTDHGYYNLGIAAAGGGLVVGYTASATVVVGESQGSDKDCWGYSLTETGLRSGRKKAPPVDNTTVCWK
ncbi:MAG: type IV pilin protein [Gammaproteobacteria bacterium]|nr:type IV pilin protein [Gammaproteobacteria bacterium]